MTTFWFVDAIVNAARRLYLRVYFGVITLKIFWPGAIGGNYLNFSDEAMAGRTGVTIGPIFRPGGWISIGEVGTGDTWSKGGVTGPTIGPGPTIIGYS